jgi:hypothetical protein
MRLARASALAVAVCTFTAAAATASATDGGAPDGGAPAPTGVPAAAPPAGADGGVPEESSGSLFEQSLAASEQPPSAAPGAAGPPPVTIGGYVRGDMFIGKVPNVNQGVMQAAYGELSMGVRTAKWSHGDGFAELRFRYGLQGEQQGLLIDAREAYVNMYAGRLDLRLGQQIIVWGRADALNPTNNLTPFDLRIRSPIEDDRRLGNMGARAFLRLAPVRLEGVWMPLYRPSELPPVILPQFVAFGTPRFPTPTLQNGLGAGRVHLELPSFEVSASYLYGYAPLPGVTLQSLTFDPMTPSVLVSRTAYNQHVVGLDFSTAIGEIVGIRGEAAYRRPIDYQNRSYAARPDLQYVLGLDHNFGAVSVVGQYLGRYVFDWVKENGNAMARVDPNAIGTILMMPETLNLRQQAIEGVEAELRRTNQILFNQTARLQHVATARVEWLTLHDTLSIAALGLFNVTTREWLLSPKIGYKLSDQMTAYVGGEIFSGPEGTLFGLIDQTLTAGYAELRASF